MRTLVLGVCVWLATTAAASAQFDTATVVGTVRDSSNAVVPAAKVTLTAVETGISTVKMSGADGNFEFPAVRPGRYLVTAEKDGFAVALVDDVQVQVGARLRVDLQHGGRPADREGRGHGRRSRWSRPTPASAVR